MVFGRDGMVQPTRPVEPKSKVWLTVMITMVYSQSAEIGIIKGRERDEGMLQFHQIPKKKITEITANIEHTIILKPTTIIMALLHQGMLRASPALLQLSSQAAPMIAGRLVPFLPAFSRSNNVGPLARHAFSARHISVSPLSSRTRTWSSPTVGISLPRHDRINISTVKNTSRPILSRTPRTSFPQRQANFSSPRQYEANELAHLTCSYIQDVSLQELQGLDVITRKMVQITQRDQDGNLAALQIVHSMICEAKTKQLFT